jgi:two-component system, OmpR family, sensor kinase
MSKRRLALRLYALTAAIAISVMLAFMFLPRFVASPRYLEPQAALVQNLVDRFSTRPADGRAEPLDRWRRRLKGKLTFYDASGTTVVASTAETLPRPTSDELAQLKSEKWVLQYRRIVVRSDDSTMTAVYVPDSFGFPWGFVLPLAGGVLLVVGAATLWFSRRLVRPLDSLAMAAQQFGSGDTTARARLHRDDELGDVGKAFDDMADRTAALISSQRQLMADVSHELRTPLARIRVALELAAEDPTAAKDVLTDVGCDLDEIDQLIEDILTTARLDTDQAPVIMKEPISVGELADRAAARFTAKHPGRTLERTVDDAERAIECDAVLLRRALDNLLDNAAKYSEPSAPVKLAVHPNGKAVSFEVIDRGVGMSREELQRAGTPFWRADGSRARRTGGVGLGLALARRIARAHGGDVSLDSTPGRGTTARLDIPTLREVGVS